MISGGNDKTAIIPLCLTNLDSQHDPVEDDVVFFYLPGVTDAENYLI
ncbi:MAG: hypothetical protein ACRCT1_12455 [Microcoleaceae cyanobacterium]